MSCYRCTATDVAAGLIEVVPDARTVAHIQKETSRVTGALKKTPLAKWLREQNPAGSKSTNHYHACVALDLGHSPCRLGVVVVVCVIAMLGLLQRLHMQRPLITLSHRVLATASQPMCLASVIATTTIS
jgi:uncharacterized membrane protein